MDQRRNIARTFVNRRGIAAITVLTAWLGGLALLLARELNPSPAAKLAEVALRVTPITTYYVVEQAGRHVGFASISIDTIPKALQVTEYMLTEATPGERKTDQLRVQLSRALLLREFESVAANGSDTTRTTGRVVDSMLVVNANGTVRDVSFTSPAFPGTIRATVSMLRDEPRVGDRVATRSIDAATGVVNTRTIRVAAESLFVVVDSAVADSAGRWFAVHRDTVRAWHMVSDETPAFDAWIDAQGLVVESTLATGVKLRRTAFELAFENWRLADPDRAVSATSDGHVVSATWLASGARKPEVVLDSLRVRFGTSISREFAARYGRSYRPGGLVTYGRTSESRLKSRYSLPTTDRWQKTFVRQLSPSPGIESDDPVIERRARRIAGGERDPTAVARRIVEWVHDSLRAEPTPASGARETLQRLAGDAREFALATTALARAAGVPAYPVTGLLQHEGKFFLHSWTEVYIGRWIPVDAMLGQFPADASHLEFLGGAADPGPDLARILTRLPITVIGSVRVP